MSPDGIPPGYYLGEQVIPEALLRWADRISPGWRERLPAIAPGPNEVRFEIIDGVEYATLRADDFRTTMRVSDAVHEANLVELRARLTESEAENDQWQKKLAQTWALITEVRKLEAIDHGVAWPDLCRALYELDRANGA